MMSFFTGLGSRRVVEAVTPARTLADVVLAPQTHRTLEVVTTTEQAILKRT